MLEDKLLEKKIGDEFTCTGVWWVPRPPCPDHPKVKRYGTLTCTPEGKYKLFTVGALDFGQSQGLAHVIAEDFSRTKTVWATTTSGEFITLFDIQNVSASSASAFIYQPTTVLVTNSKRWFASVEDVTFDKLRLRYKHLVAWASTSGISELLPQDLHGVERGSQSFSIKRPFVLQTVDVGDYVISLWVGRHLHLSNILISKPKDTPNLTYANDTNISIKPNEGKITLENAKELIRVISNFLSLVMGERTFNESIEGIVDLGDVQRVDIIKVFPSAHIPQHIEAVSQTDMLFPYQDITGLFKGALRKMFVKEMQPLYNQFFAERFQPSVYAEDEFMAAIRAIEVFHRRAMGGDYVVKSDYESCDDRLASLVDTLVEKSDFETLEAANKQALKDSLYKKLTYGYQYSLQRRLKDVLRDQGKVFLELFVNEKVNTKVRDDFVSKVVKTRNYYTHYDDEDKEAAITDPEELKLTAERLIVLLYMLLLHYVGVPKEDVDAAIRRHSESRYYKFGYLRAN